MNRTLLIAALLAAAPVLAQWAPDKPKTTTKTDTAAPPPPAPAKRAPRAAARTDDDGSGFGLGLRGAWALPSGGVTADQGLGDALSWQLPVWIEAGYHFDGNLYAGAYFQYAFGFNNCLSASTCSSHGMRFGIEALYHFLAGSAVQPWAGLGFGYETLNYTRSGDDRSARGFELLNLQAGVDYALAKSFSVGPFASYQLLGKYSTFSAGGITNDVRNTSGHSWLQVGLKASFKL